MKVLHSTSTLIRIFALLPLVAAAYGLPQAVPTAHAATFTVTNNNDSGAGSLRWAIDL
jgi:hypothetical protein